VAAVEMFGGQTTHQKQCSNFEVGRYDISATGRWCPQLTELGRKIQRKVSMEACRGIL